MQARKFAFLLPLMVLAVMLIALPRKDSRVVLRQRGIHTNSLTLTNLGEDDFRLKKTKVKTTEVDGSSPYDRAMSKIDFTFSIKGPKHAKHARRHKANPPGVVEIDLKAPKARTFQLHQIPSVPVTLAPTRVQATRKTQQLSSEYLESVGINTGGGNHDDHRVDLGEKNPAVFFAAGRQAPDLMPNDPPTAHPPRHGGKLLKLGVNTGEKHDSWDDDDIKVKGTEEPYNWGSSPDRDTRSPNQRDGGWGWI
mmetsp:Transcript_541/g.915  ORF Transcript_541/g.915 Transcript_541/m.915 type:complete len:251 (+) Transcript_541:176-928(+)